MVQHHCHSFDSAVSRNYRLCAGQASIRPYWRNYYDNTDALIFVVDSFDEDRMEEVKAELTMLLGEDKLAGVPLLVFANKQDQAGALTADEISMGLELEEISDRDWSIQGCSALEGSGLPEGMEWVVAHIKAKAEGKAAGAGAGAAKPAAAAPVAAAGGAAAGGAAAGGSGSGS